LLEEMTGRECKNINRTNSIVKGKRGGNMEEENKKKSYWCWGEYLNRMYEEERMRNDEDSMRKRRTGEWMVQRHWNL
jgi:hypothetical protein